MRTLSRRSLVPGMHRYCSQTTRPGIGAVKESVLRHRRPSVRTWRVPEEEIMNVASILKSKGKNVVTTRPDAKIAEVVRELKDERIGALVVSEDKIEVLGIISERDIVRGLADHGLDLLDMRVDELMTREVFTCAPTDRTSKLMAKITERRIRHLPVIENGALCGIVSIGDVVKVRLDEIESEANALRDYISGRR